MTTEQVTRYDLVTNYPMGEPWNEIEEQLDGAYVLWKDYKELRERNAWLENYVKACDNEVRRAAERKRQWELEPPHCSSCSCGAPDVPCELCRGARVVNAIEPNQEPVPCPKCSGVTRG